MDNLNKESIHNSAVMKEIVSHPNNRVALHLFAVISGLFSISGYFIMISQSYGFEVLFPGQGYSFLVIMPRYFAVILNIVLAKFLQKLSLTSKIYGTLVGSILLFSSIPILIILFKGRSFGLWPILAAYLISESCFLLLQGYLIALFSMFPPKFTVIFFTCVPIANIVVMAIKWLSLRFSTSIGSDFLIIWSYFIISGLGVLALFSLVLKMKEIKEFTAKENLESKSNKKEIKLVLTIKLIKWDMLTMFFTMFLTFLIYPGVVFSLYPASLFTQKEYIAIVNTIVAVFDVVGRPFGGMSFNRLTIPIQHVISLLIILLITIAYFTGLGAQYEGFCFVVFVLIAYLIFRTSIGISYSLISAGKKADPSNQEAIGMLMINTLMIGIATGNISSNIFSWIKSYLA